MGNTVIKKRTIDDAVIEQLRNMPVSKTLDALNLYWKHDVDFVPMKDKQTIRLYVSVENRVYELLVTGVKWFDTRVERGGAPALLI
jgi:hypothetical protein